MNNLCEIQKLNKADIIIIFNDQLLEFINQIEFIINDLYKNKLIDEIIKDDIIYYKNIANSIIHITKIYFIESLGKYILKNNSIVEAVKQKNTDYIASYNFENDSSLQKYKDKYKNNLEITDLIIIFKKILLHLNEENKNNLFEYFQIFFEITIIYMSKI
jgi:hypothetical protein